MRAYASSARPDAVTGGRRRQRRAYDGHHRTGRQLPSSKTVVKLSSRKGVHMQIAHRILLASALLVFPASIVRAQASPDLSGHWEGSVRSPGMELAFQIDLVRSASGELAGTI